MSEKLEDHVIFCLECDGLDVRLRIRRLETLAASFVWEGHEATLEEALKIIQYGWGPEIENLGFDDVNAWWTDSEDELWESMITYICQVDDALNLKDIVHRFVQFKIDGKFDGEED